MKVTKDLVAASATPMVLGILAEQESYGYAILKRINELSGGEHHGDAPTAGLAMGVTYAVGTEAQVALARRPAAPSATRSGPARCR